MPENANRLLRAAAARADFLESGRPGAAGVSDVLAASWERSQAAGVDSTRPQSDFAQTESGLLARCSDPVLRQLGTDTTDLPLVIALSDDRARVLQRIDNSAAVGRLLDRVDLAPGYNFSETQMGTNGIGTVFAAGQPVSVVGPEHFAENLQAFACTGAPILDPITGRVLGVLDISTLSQSWSPILHTLVKSAAKDISRNLLMDRSQSQQAVFDTYLRADARASRQAVFAFGDSIFMANSAAQTLFSPAEQQTLREHADFLTTRREQASDTITLPDGRRVAVRGTRIVAGCEVAGTVVIADLVTHCAGGGHFTEQVLPAIAVATRETSAIAGDLGRARRPITGGGSPPWTRACDDLRAAMLERRPTLLHGETGAGKFTLVAETFHECYPAGRSISIDAAQVTSDGPGEDLSALLGSPTGECLYIVRNLDQASTDGVDQLDRFFAAVGDLEGPAWCVATLSDTSLDSDLPFHPLLAHFEVAVAVPGLRHRTDDLAGITATLLHDIAPERRVRLSPEAVRVVARYSWPRNVAQLREALEHALRRRPVGEIQAADLPGYCQTTARHVLTPLEAAERDTIVEALREHDGNRVAASAHLGMARSSLYRKLKSYGITV